MRCEPRTPTRRLERTRGLPRSRCPSLFLRQFLNLILSLTLTLLLSLSLPVSPASAQAKAPIVAVMNIEAVGVKLPAGALDRLSLYLTGRLGATGRYKVVPREQVKRRLVELKTGPYRSKDCDESCLIELGKAVVADKTIATQVIRAGASCAVTLNVLDLLQEASEGGASVEGGCDENGIVESLKAAVAQLLAGGAGGQGLQTPPPSAPPQTPPSTPAAPVVEETRPKFRVGTVTAAVGDLTILGKTPSGAPVRLEITDPSGRTEARGSPYKAPQAAVGPWKVVAKASGHEPQEQAFRVPPDDVTAIRIELKPFGGLRVTGEPAGAAVRVTGPGGFANDGGLPWEAEGLRSGAYRVEVRRPGYAIDARDVAVEPGRTAAVAVRLEKEDAGGGAGRGWVRIPAGTFTMGSPESEAGRNNNEKPHTVRITRAFLLKATEVTQGEWRELMGNNPSSFRNCGDDCPVENVSWWDALAYVNALSKREGLTPCYKLSGCTGTPGSGAYRCGGVTFRGLSCPGYRLPTEAEWEYAARAGTTTPYYTGSSPDGAGWYDANSGSTTHPVGKKQANAWGLSDMLGNVSEWVWDWKGDYSGGEVTDPTGPSSGSGRVRRGGCWYNYFRNVRAAIRIEDSPGNRYNLLGFRPARSLGR